MIKRDMLWTKDCLERCMIIALYILLTILDLVHTLYSTDDAPSGKAQTLLQDVPLEKAQNTAEEAIPESISVDPPTSGGDSLVGREKEGLQNLASLSSHHPIAKDLLVLGLLAGLLLYGTFTDHPGDPGLYQCYAQAFWQGGQCGSVPNEIVPALQHWGFPSGLVQFVATQSSNLPYHALPNEYPFLALLPFSLGLIAPDSWYQTAFGLWMVLLAGCVYFVLLRWRSRQAALAYSLYVVVGGWMTVAGRFDLVPAALTLFAMICAGRKHWNWAFRLLALATLSKMYPAILLIPFLLALQQETPGTWYAWRRWQPVGAFVRICVLVIGVSLLLSVAGTVAPLQYFIDRPVQIESLPASLLWIASVLWKTPLEGVVSFRSPNFLSPLSSHVILVMNVMLIAGLLATWWLQWRRRMDLPLACLLTLLMLLVTGKVSSIQYLIWVIPLAAYVGQGSRRWLLFWTVIGLLNSWRLTVLLTSWIFPSVTFLYTTPLFYTIRNFLLVGFILAMLISRTHLSRPLSFELPLSWCRKESLKQICSFLSHDPIARCVQDVLVVGFLVGLLLSGVWIDQPWDPMIYQCDAVAFWHGWSGFQLSPGLSGQCGFLVDPNQDVMGISQGGILHALQQWRFPSGLIQLVAAQSPGLAYHSLPSEYPLMALASFSLGLLTPVDWYRMAFALWMALLAAGIYVVLRLCRSRGAALAAALYLVVGGWRTAAGRFDIVPTALTLFAVICAERKCWNWAFALLALATFCKLYPAILLIPFLLALQQETPGTWYVWRRWLPVGVFGGISVLVVGVSFFLSVLGTLAPFAYFIDRPVQVESLSASLLWVSSLLGKTPLAYGFSFGARSVISSLSSSVTSLMNIVLVGGLLWTWWLQWCRRIGLAMACLLTLLLVLVTGKVFSTQFLIWVLPLVAYVGQRKQCWLFFWTLVGFLTTFIYICRVKDPPYAFFDPYTPFFNTVLTVRNVLLLVFIFLMLIYASLLCRPFPSDEERTAE